MNSKTNLQAEHLSYINPDEVLGSTKAKFEGFAQLGNWADDFGKHIRNSVVFSKRPKTLALFSGAGGLDIGFTDAGFDIVEHVELEKQFVKTLEENSGQDKYFYEEPIATCIDIANYHPKHSKIDFIIGGPPCQSFSAAGARASGVAGAKDKRGNLFREYVRLLLYYKPKGFLFENVYRIIGANKGRDWNAIVTEFTKAGYSLKFRILDTADFGVAQHRERLIIIGIRSDIAEKVDYQFPRPTHGPDSDSKLPHFSAKNSIFGIQEDCLNKCLGGRYGYLLSEIPPGLNYSYFTEKMGHPNPIFAWRSKFSDFLYKADPNVPVRTIKAQGGQYTGPFHWDSRAFNSNELKRLQSFPDRYKITGGKLEQVKQIGNSVPPQFARILALSVAKRLFGAKIPTNFSFLKETETLSFRTLKSKKTKHYASVATEAIRNITVRKVEIKPRAYFGNLADDFSWNDDKSRTFKVSEVIENNNLSISLLDLTQNSQVNSTSIKITIRPKQCWQLPYTEVSLELDCYTNFGFTALWKAFETFLRRNSIKADIVQLAGYYQYPCSFECKVHCENSDSFQKFLIHITEGAGINAELTEQNIFDRLNVEATSLVPYLLRLKAMGFEVRSSMTNVSFKKGIYLIPYCFPTLTEKSVQRLKALI